MMVISEIKDLAFQTQTRKIVDIAKWSRELLVSMDIQSHSQDPEPQLPTSSVQDNLPLNEMNRLQLAQLCMETQEFHRAAKFVEGFDHPLLLFVHFYSKYLAGEKQKLDTMADIGDRSKIVENESLNEIKAALEVIHAAGQLDCYMLYLYGLVLRDAEDSAKAEQIFLEAIQSNSLFYGAWKELAGLIKTRDQLDALKLPDHWIKQFFLGEVYLSLHLPDEALVIYKCLTEQYGFQQSSFVLAQMALAEQSLQNMSNCVDLFRKVLEIDPYRVQDMGCFSNALHVKGERIELANLAHRLCKINKYCPETCVVVGNYYSLRGEHENAIIYFQRAIRLDPKHGGAWTLMGHEFMELKNSAAAILAYRHGIEVDPKDFKAWYGLGQCYEILKMSNYAFYYYETAHKLRPQDSRMIVALAEMFEKQNKLEDARKCLWKAHCIGDFEGFALFKLGKLYEKMKDPDQAASMYSKFLRQLDEQDIVDSENQPYCYKYLATYHINKNQLDDAQEFAQLCLECDSVREEGKGTLKLISQLRSEAAKSASQPQFTQTPAAATLRPGGDTGEARSRQIERMNNAGTSPTNFG